MMSNRNHHARRGATGDGPISLHLIIAALSLCFLVASPAAGQTATYSDSWFVNNSGASYDPENDLDLYPETESESSLVAGAGISEASYDSYLESVETTLTSPDGRSVSGSSYSSPYARVELTLSPIDSETEEYQYDVQTVHTYWYDRPEEPASRG